MTTAPLVDCAYLHSAFGPGCPYCWQPAVRGDQKRRRTRGPAAGGPDRPGEGRRLRYFAGGRLSAEEGATQLGMMPAAPAVAAQDPAALENTRRGSAGTPAAEGEGEAHASRGTARFRWARP
ncbi:MAG: hypothetical protein ABR926_10935 [Streptosporangiaceae bacterium]